MLTRVFFLLIAGGVVGFAGEWKSPNIGDAVPQFTLNNYDGNEYSLEHFVKQNKLTVVMFIATQCPISNAYNSRMVDLYNEYSAKGVAFIGINSNKQEPVDEIASHARDNGFTFPVLKDDRNIVADRYGAQVTPEIFLVDAKGLLVYHGRIDDNRNISRVVDKDLAAALDATLASRKPPRTETKAFGCTIKRVREDS